MAESAIPVTSAPPGSATTTPAVADATMTASDLHQLPSTTDRRELVRGRIATKNPYKPRHGFFCLRWGVALSLHVDLHGFGHVVSNDSGIVTETEPDTFRGADVAVFSFDRVPTDDSPEDYAVVAPEVVVVPGRSKHHVDQCIRSIKASGRSKHQVDQCPAEVRQVVGAAAGDVVAVDNDGGVFVHAVGVDQIVLDPR